MLRPPSCTLCLELVTPVFGCAFGGSRLQEGTCWGSRFLLDFHIISVCFFVKLQVLLRMPSQYPSQAMAYKDRTLAFGRMLENTPVSANKNVQWPDGSELPKVTLERHPSFLAFIRTKEALLRKPCPARPGNR